MARRLFIAAIIASALGAPIVEVFDSWDQSLPSGTDTEANVAVVALCTGVAFAIGTIVIAACIRALSSTSAGPVVGARVAVRDVASVLAPVPTVSPPAFMRGVLKQLIFAFAAMLATSALSQAQTSEGSPRDETVPAASLFGASALRSFDTDGLFAQQPAPAPPPPRHTGIKALTQHLFTNFKYLPSRENLLWAGAGGGLALAAHPFDDNVNEWFRNNPRADRFFKPGAVLGELYTLLPTASVIYAVGRIKDQPKVSHLGMDLIESLAMSEALTQALKYSTRRERPDGSGRNSFPSGHAADTFAFATALERHLNWRFSVPAYVFASYVAISRLPANRHWLSDTVFGSAVGIIAGRTVTSHEAERPYPVAVTVVPGGLAVVYLRNK